MNSIIITSIICVSLIIIIGIFCYTCYKSDKNNDANIFNKNVTHTIVQYDNILKEINNLKTLTNSIQNGIEFISMQISNKENKDE